MKDRHRVERIRSVKARLRDVQRSKLAAADRARHVAAAAADEADTTLDQAIARLVHVGDLSARDLAGHAALVEVADRDAGQARDTLRERVAARTSAADSVVRASREVKALEVLQGRLERAEQHEEKKREQRNSDELAGRKASRRGMS